MANVKNDLLADFSNQNGAVNISQLANAFLVSSQPKYGDESVSSHQDQKSAEIDYSYHKHYFTNRGDL